MYSRPTYWKERCSHVFGYLSAHLYPPNAYPFTSSKAVGQSVLHFPWKFLSCLPSKNRADRQTADSEQVCHLGVYAWMWKQGAMAAQIAQSWTLGIQELADQCHSPEKRGCHIHCPPQRRCAQSWSETSLAVGAGSSQRPQSGTGRQPCAAGGESLAVRLSLAGRSGPFPLSPIRSGR